MDALAREIEKEERKANTNIRNLVGEGTSNATSVVDSEETSMTIDTEVKY